MGFCFCFNLKIYCISEGHKSYGLSKYENTHSSLNVFMRRLFNHSETIEFLVELEYKEKMTDANNKSRHMRTFHIFLSFSEETKKKINKTRHTLTVCATCWIASNIWLKRESSNSRICKRNSWIAYGRVVRMMRRGNKQKLNNKIESTSPPPPPLD